MMQITDNGSTTLIITLNHAHLHTLFIGYQEHMRWVWWLYYIIHTFSHCSWL